MKKSRFKPALSNLKLLYQGKTRDTFKTLYEHLLLIVATKRLSTHNVVHQSEIAFKDQVLTALTIFWMTKVLPDAGIPHHLVAYGTDIYKYLPGKRRDYPDDLHLRAIVVLKLDIIPIEFIYRGYLVGGIYDKFYSKGIQNPYGIILQSDLPVMWKFEKPIFTPTDKSDTDPDRDGLEIEQLYQQANELGLKTFNTTRKYLQGRDLEELDGKFEIGKDVDGNLYVADECATPDSSRFCNLGDVREGILPSWRDKQKARDQAERVWGKKKGKPIKFSPQLEKELSDTYLELFEQVVNLSLEDFQKIYLN